MAECLRCGVAYEQRNSLHRYCSRRCRDKALHGVEYQRAWVSGNWQRYLNRLAKTGQSRKGLSTQDLLDILEEQGGRCALSGVKMTNILVEGRRVWTNASVDRIISGGPYIKSNIQLVCAAVNNFRSQMSIEEYREWCRLVARFRGLPKRK